MPRPGFTPNRPGAAKAAKSSNPLRDWWESRKERRSQIEEEAASMITNKITENEATLIDQLTNIDFSRSELPKHVLEKRAREDMPFCELEFSVQGLIRKLQRSPQTIKMDIRKIDEKLLVLVLLLKQSVAQGDVRAAYAAKGALMKGILDIRSLIPQDQPQLARQFVEDNSAYLDQWTTLVYLAQTADRTEKNLKAQKENYQAAQDEHNEKVDALKTRLLNDLHFNEIYLSIVNYDTPEDRQHWSPEQKEIHRMLIDRKMDQLRLQINTTLVHQMETEMTVKQSMVDMLESKLVKIPVVTDPNLMNKYHEQMEDLVKQMAANDAEIDEMLKSTDDILGRIEQLNSAPGAVRAREVAAEMAQDALEEIKRKQEKQIGMADIRHKERLQRMGIYTEEEMAVLRKQAEEAAQAQAQAVAQLLAEDNLEEEDNQNYN